MVRNGMKDSKTKPVTLYDIPRPVISPLCGVESKTRKLYRVGTAVTLGPDSLQPDLWWQGLYNDGSRTCLYKHEFTFNSDGTYEFSDHNVFWRDHEI
jgi:hypothetical protein